MQLPAAAGSSILWGMGIYWLAKAYIERRHALIVADWAWLTPSPSEIWTGVITAAVIFAATWPIKWFLRRRERTRRAAETANREAVHGVATLLGEGASPTARTIEASLRGLARQHGINRGDIYTVDELLDDVARQALEAPFLTRQGKMSYFRVIESIREEAAIDVSVGRGRSLNAVPTSTHVHQNVRRAQQARSLAALSLGLVATFAASILQIGWFGAIAVVAAGTFVTVVLAAVVFVLVTNLSKRRDSVPAVTISQDEAMQTLTVVSANAADWSQFVLTSTASPRQLMFGLNGPPGRAPGRISEGPKAVNAGDVITFQHAHGGPFQVQVIHLPTNIQIGTWTFVA